MTRPAWYLDWTGQIAAVVASGPSTKRVNYKALEGRVRTIAIKENIELCPWAEVLYGCDAAFWRNSMGQPNFKGLKVAYKSAFSTVQSIKIDATQDRLLVKDPGLIGCGGNSGFQALNLAIQFGATKILLVGFDMHDRSGIHWYGRANGDGRSNPGEWNFKRWRKAFDVASTQLPKLGVEVLNASPLTCLTCFPVVTVEQALERWNA